MASPLRPYARSTRFFNAGIVPSAATADTWRWVRSSVGMIGVGFGLIAIGVGFGLIAMVTIFEFIT